MHFLFLFIDGVGLGPDDPESNPLAGAPMPNLVNLLEGRKLVRQSLPEDGQPFVTEFATLVALDSTLGVEGHPQSATGQAAILTGSNIPQMLGYHYGPKPNPAIRNLLAQDNIFQAFKRHGRRASLLNAYPQTYFDRIDSGRGLPGAVAMAVQLAGIPLMNTKDILAGRALSADFTGEGWRQRLKIPDVPVYSLAESGYLLANLAQDYDFAFFEYWLSDYAGHRADMDQSSDLLQAFDAMLGGLLDTWKGVNGLIFITSDHGNLEDTTTRRHTSNAVPGLVIGPAPLRQEFISDLVDLTDIVPAILKLYQ